MLNKNFVILPKPAYTREAYFLETFIKRMSRGKELSGPI